MLRSAQCQFKSTFINHWLVILLEENVVLFISSSNKSFVKLEQAHPSIGEPNSTLNRSLTEYSQEKLSGRVTNEEIKGEDIWSMVASMGGDEPLNSRENHLARSQSTEYDWHMMLDESNQIGLDWTVEYSENRVIFALTINKGKSNFQPGSDVFALGFSQDGQLASSDFCIIWYDLSYQAHLQDARTDKENNLELIDEAESFCKLIKLQSKRRGQFSNSRGSSRNSLLRQFNSNHKASDYDDLDAASDSMSGYDKLAARNPRVPMKQFEKQFEGKNGGKKEELVEIIFRRPLDVCSDSSYYKIDNGTTHLVWFTIKGPLLSIDRLNLSELTVGLDPAETAQNHHYHHHHSSGLDPDRPFKWGMKRAQVVASKFTFPSSEKRAIRTKSHEIRMSKFLIPNQETTYRCKLFKLPRRFQLRRQHITRYEAVIDTGNEDIVHHMELFNCATLNRAQEMALQELYERQGGWEGDCNGSQRPNATDPCRKVILAWAMGAHPLEYPEQVGQSIGGQSYNPYVVLEVHYNNKRGQRSPPEVSAHSAASIASAVTTTTHPSASSSTLSPQLEDNSGLRFEYTGKLRRFDAGILEVGLEYSDKNSIPPHLITPMAGYCASECTRVGLSDPAGKITSSDRRAYEDLDGSRESEHWSASREERPLRNPSEGGIFVFAAQMHTHLAGVASWTEQVREGRVLRELQRDNHYSPHFQEIRVLPEPVHIAPGDALIHYCLYDTTKRTKITLGGYATTDEMCVTYLHYYPRVQLEVCKSSIDSRALEAYFARLALEESQPTSLGLLEERHAVQPSRAEYTNLLSVADNYRAIKWSPRRSLELIQLYANSPLSIQCNRSDGSRMPGFWNGVTPTRVHFQRSGMREQEANAIDGRALTEYRGAFGMNEFRHAQCTQGAQDRFASSQSRLEWRLRMGGSGAIGK